jgi:hypothetical protein
MLRFVNNKCNVQLEKNHSGPKGRYRGGTVLNTRCKGEKSRYTRQTDTKVGIWSNETVKWTVTAQPIFGKDNVAAFWAVTSYYLILTTYELDDLLRGPGSLLLET